LGPEIILQDKMGPEIILQDKSGSATSIVEKTKVSFAEKMEKRKNDIEAGII